MNRRRLCHVWTYMDSARLQSILAKLQFKVTTADVYPASLRGMIDHRREPRWIFARFHHNDAKALAEPCRSGHQVREATEVTRFASFRHRLQL
jgi:hypothetical protein